MKRFRPFAALGVLACLAFARQASATEQCNQSNFAGLNIRTCFVVNTFQVEAGIYLQVQAYQQDDYTGSFRNVSSDFEILDGSTVIASGHGNTVYSPSLVFSSVGTHALKARSPFLTTPAINVTVIKHVPVFRGLSANPAMAFAGQSTNVFAEIEYYRPTGTLTFSVQKPNGAIVDIGSKSINYPSSFVYVSEPRTFAFSGDYAAPGNYNFFYKYSGDALNAAASSGFVLVRVGPFATTTGLAQSIVDTKQAVSFTLTASVGGALSNLPAPSGTVEFYDGSTLLGTATLDLQSKATFTASLGSVGSHALQAKYLGDSNYQSSTSTSLAHGIQFNPAILAPILEQMLE